METMEAMMTAKNLLPGTNEERLEVLPLEGYAAH